MEVYYKWENEKNERLKKERDICFEQIVMHIEKGDLLDVIEHNNQSKYPGQKMLIVDVNGYVYLVPFVEEQQSIYFLKTIMPSRKATKKILER